MICAWLGASAEGRNCTGRSWSRSDATRPGQLSVISGFAPGAGVADGGVAGAIACADAANQPRPSNSIAPPAAMIEDRSEAKAAMERSIMVSRRQAYPKRRPCVLPLMGASGAIANDMLHSQMEFIIRKMGVVDRAAWSEVRAALWPEQTSQAHADAIDRLLADGETWGFVAQAPDGTVMGFAEIAIRKYANGCESAPVPFLEGIWVKAQFRRRGIGARLIEHAESFVKARGFREIGSDTDIANLISQAAHVAWGFSETERVVYFRKLLKV